MLSTVKDLHIALATISGTGFLIRGCWMLRGSPRLRARWVRIAPHVVDVLLLGSGVTLAVGLSISPGSAPWLAVKLGALVGYIGLGLIALRLGRTRSERAAAFFLALAVFAYIVAVALRHDPTPWG